MGVATKKGRAYLYVAAVVALLIFVGTVQQQGSDHYPELKDAIFENLRSFGRVSGADSDAFDDMYDDDDDDEEDMDEYIEFGSSLAKDYAYSSDPDDHPLRKHPGSGKASSSSSSSHQYPASAGGGGSSSLYADEAIDARDQPSFYEIAIEKGTDKVTMHTYHDMYERYLPSLRNRRIKLLEIGGLGCTLANGPGPSYYTWLEYFPYAELYFLEPDAECVDKWRDKIKGAKVVVSGDQADASFLDGFLGSLGFDSDGSSSAAAALGDTHHHAEAFQFDVIIDDGGHMMDQQMVSLQTLWKAVKPGGTYFVEDLETSYLEAYGGGRAAAANLGRKETMVQMLQKMTEDLMYPDARMEVYRVEEGQEMAWHRKVQFDEVESITHIDCSRQICAISKRRD